MGILPRARLGRWLFLLPCLLLRRGAYVRRRLVPAGLPPPRGQVRLVIRTRRDGFLGFDPLGLGGPERGGGALVRLIAREPRAQIVVAFIVS